MPVIHSSVSAQATESPLQCSLIVTDVRAVLNPSQPPDRLFGA
ncbi:MAG: hypothetical protein A07HR60_02495, partial [uncultured archaeon A07HR60]